MGFAPTWLHQVSPPASHDHFNHWKPDITSMEMECCTWTSTYVVTGSGPDSAATFGITIFYTDDDFEYLTVWQRQAALWQPCRRYTDRIVGKETRHPPAACRTASEFHWSAWQVLSTYKKHAYLPVLEGWATTAQNEAKLSNIPTRRALSRTNTYAKVRTTPNTVI